MRHLLEGEPHRVLAQHASVAHPLRRWDGHPHLPFDAFGEPFDAFGERPDGLLEDGGPVVPLRQAMQVGDGGLRWRDGVLCPGHLVRRRGLGMREVPAHLVLADVRRRQSQLGHRWPDLLLHQPVCSFPRLVDVDGVDPVAGHRGPVEEHAGRAVPVEIHLRYVLVHDFEQCDHVPVRVFEL
jgi:hypothetical protein